MADKYERYLMKQRMKEARHQAKLDDLRRKRELAEIEDVKSKTRSRNVGSFAHLIFVLMEVVVIFCILVLPIILIFR